MIVPLIGSPKPVILKGIVTIPEEILLKSMIGYLLALFNRPPFHLPELSNTEKTDNHPVKALSVPHPTCAFILKIKNSPGPFSRSQTLL